ncbi:MAG: hypothetical protein WC475_00205 [Candidatus Paceibacterota bacterium]
MEKLQKILELMNSKGWNVYCRGKPNAEIDLSVTYQMGPVKILEKGTCYIIMPRIENPTNQGMVQDYRDRHKLIPKIRLPRKGSNYVGKELIGPKNAEEEIELCPGTTICLFGFEPQSWEIRLVLQNKTFIPYDVFLEALDSLQDITALA